MPPPPKHPIRISPAYVRELRARLEVVGESAVAKAAGMARATVWRATAPNSDRDPTPDTIERIRRAVAKLDPQGGPVPPPLVAVRGHAHHKWIALADEVSADELARVADDPRLVAAVLAVLKRRPR
jgi:hypothetical protein